MRLATPEEAIKHIVGRIRSHEWWCILAPDSMGAHMACDVEQKYYTEDGANKDFELIMAVNPFPGCAILGVFLGRKSRMSAAELKTVIDGHTGQDEHDLLAPQTVLGMAASMWILEQVHPDDEPQPETKRE